MTLTIGAAATFGALSLLLFSVQSTLVQRRRVYRTLRGLRASDRNPATARERELAVPALQRLAVPALRVVGSRLRRFTPVSVLERLDQELAYAGSPRGWDAERLLATKIALAAILTVGGLVVPTIVGLGPLRTLILAPLLGLLGYYVPEWTVRARSGERQSEMQRALPDALDLLSITVQAGLGFDSAVDRTAKELGGPLGSEFHRLVQEMRLGRSRADSLRELGNRTTVAEFRSFVLAMVQADMFGIPIARVLNVQAKEMRIKRRQRAEEQAQKLPVKIVFPLVLCVFPSLFIILLGPAAIQIYDAIVAN